VEKACSFAIAEMRQNNHLFDKIVEFHDKAMTWIRSNELVFEAREIISTYRTNSSDENRLVNSSSDDLNSGIHIIYFIQGSTINVLFLTVDIITITSEVSAESKMGKEFDRLAGTKLESEHIDSVMSESSDMSQIDDDTPQLKKTYSFSILTAKLNEFTNQRDENAITMQSNYLTNLQVSKYN